MQPTNARRRAGAKLSKLSKADALEIFAAAVNVLRDSGMKVTLGNNETGLAVVVRGAALTDDGERLATRPSC